ncbi:hypothetical protein [Tessaracoccus sp.]
MRSTPSSSARIQSAPAGIFSIRSPYPVDVSRTGAAAMTARSATSPAGAGQSRVILKPSTEIDAPYELNPSTEAAVQTFR